MYLVWCAIECWIGGTCVYLTDDSIDVACVGCVPTYIWSGRESEFGMAFFIWAVVRADDGLGPMVKQRRALQGSALAWAVIKGIIMSAIANFATLIVNDPDFTRFAHLRRNRPQRPPPPDGSASDAAVISALWSVWLCVRGMYFPRATIFTTYFVCVCGVFSCLPLLVSCAPIIIW